MKKLITSCLILTVLSCSPRIKIETSNVRPTHTVKASDPFAIVFDQNISIDTSKHLGKIEILEGGLTVKCDLTTIKSIAKERAMQLGGNMIVVYEHMKPDMKSTCHRIRGNVYYVNDPSAYETEIMWHKNRKLKIADFKGTIENRPFQAATYSGINYMITPKPFTKKYKLSSEAYFDCKLSYFKRSNHDQSVLDHEQIHFDITELYRRKLMKEYADRALKIVHLSNGHETIFKEIYTELSLKQDEYDAEVYADRSQQPKWNQWVRDSLAKYENYSMYEIEIKGKN